MVKNGKNAGKTLIMTSKTFKRDGNDSFLQLSRFLLVSHPFFAQLLAALVKQESPGLGFPITLSWRKGKPVLLYQNNLLNQLLKDENKAVEQALHELLHLLLAHSTLSRERTASPFIDAAADIQVWSWLDTMLGHTVDHIFFFHPLFEEARNLKIGEFANLLSQNRRYGNAIKLIPQSTFSSHEYWKNENDDNGISCDLWTSWWLQIRQSLPLDLLESKFRQKLALNINIIKPLPWRLVSRRFANNASRIFNKNSLRRPSKRYGVLPGIRRKRQQRLLVIIDTSGSVGEIELQSFFNEIHWLYRQGAQLTLVQADHKIQGVSIYEGQMPDWVWGRGGTSFDPALKFANESGAFDGVLYFTDGQGEMPSVICRYPLLWVLTANQKLEKFNDWQGQLVSLQS